MHQNALQCYTTIERILDTVEKLKRMLETVPEVKAFRFEHGWTWKYTWRVYNIHGHHVYCTWRVYMEVYMVCTWIRSRYTRIQGVHGFTTKVFLFIISAWSNLYPCILTMYIYGECTWKIYMVSIHGERYCEGEDWAFQRADKLIKKGYSVSKAMRESKLYPPTVQEVLWWDMERSRYEAIHASEGFWEIAQLSILFLDASSWDPDTIRYRAMKLSILFLDASRV